jgi:hypothetical protein
METCPREGGGWVPALLTTHYSLLTTHYSLLTTHYSLLPTHYSLLTTRQSPLPCPGAECPKSNSPPKTAPVRNTCDSCRATAGRIGCMVECLWPATLESACIDGPRTASSRQRRRPIRNVHACGTSSRWIACGLPPPSENQSKKAFQLVGHFPASLIVVELPGAFVDCTVDKTSSLSNRIQTRNGESGLDSGRALLRSRRRPSRGLDLPAVAGSAALYV